GRPYAASFGVLTAVALIGLVLAVLIPHRSARQHRPPTDPEPCGPSISRRLRLTHATEESTAAGIYGVIVSAAVMTASHASSATAMIVAVLGTLTIYWGAERYSRLVAERIPAGHPPTWRPAKLPLTPPSGMMS